MSSETRITTGQSSFEDGVDSSKVPLIQSAKYPNGLRPTQLAWLQNGTVRGGAIQPRFGYKRLCKVADGSTIYQGGWLYDASPNFPYLMLSIGGRMIQVRVDTDNSVVDVTGAFADPATVEKAYFDQGEQFMVKQSGDGVTLPLFWDGVTLRRSDGTQRNLGVTAIAAVAPAVGFNVDITLTSPFRGYTNQIVLLNGAQYIQVIPGNFYVIKNLANSNTASIIPAGTPLLFPNGSLVGRLLASVVVPAIGATVNVKVTPAYTGPALPTPITINNIDWEIDSTGTAAPGVNHVYLVNLTDTPGNAIASSSTLYSVQELPAATAMVYYMNRLWYAQGRIYTAGDIVSSTASGTVPYNFKDSILKVTENPLAVGGDGFSVPTSSGDIRALNYPIELDTALGQGPLFVFTQKQIYALTVPVTRLDWIAADSNNMPRQRVVMNNNGTVSDRSVVAVNGDLVYQSLDPAIRSFFMSLRYFGTWGNSPISNNVGRIIDLSDRGLMHTASGWGFGNRVYETVLPKQTNVGIAFDAVAVLDLDPISTLQDQKPPAWDGASEGLDFLQGFSGNFGGLERAFAVVHSRLDGSIEVWELTSEDRFNQDDVRTTMWFETPTFDWNEYPKDQGGGLGELKELDGLDIYLDRIFGDVLFKVEYRPDSDNCWYDWGTFKTCAARTSCEDLLSPQCYPIEQKSEQYRNPICLPKPKSNICQIGNKRPTTWAGSFQLRITQKGWARIRRLDLHALAKDKSPFLAQKCADESLT